MCCGVYFEARKTANCGDVFSCCLLSQCQQPTRRLLCADHLTYISAPPRLPHLAHHGGDLSKAVEMLVVLCLSATSSAAAAVPTVPVRLWAPQARGCR